MIQNKTAIFSIFWPITANVHRLLWIIYQSDLKVVQLVISWSVGGYSYISGYLLSVNVFNCPSSSRHDVGKACVCSANPSWINTDQMSAASKDKVARMKMPPLKQYNLCDKWCVMQALRSFMDMTAIHQILHESKKRCHIWDPRSVHVQSCPGSHTAVG